MKRTLADIVGLESIYFQNDNTGKEIEALIEKITKVVNENSNIKDVARSKQWIDLEQYLQKRFGINVTLYIAPVGDGAYFYPEDGTINLSHLIYQDTYFDSAYREDKNSKENRINFNYKKNGGVDLKNAKIYGSFSDVKVAIVIAVDYFLDNTTSQITGVLLHEVGHIFSMFEYISYTQITNFVLNYISSTCQNNPEKLEIALKKAEDQLDLTNGELRSVYKQNDEIVVMSAIAKATAEKMDNELFNKDNGYYNNIAEGMADDFSARFGYGKDLVELLVSRANYEDKSTKGQPFSDFQTEIYTSFMFGISLLILSASPLTGIVFGLLSGFVAYTSDGEYQNYGDRIYDFDDARFRRIKNTTIGKLNHVTDNKLRKAIIADIEQIEKYIDAVQTKYPRIFFAIRKFFSSTQRKEQAIAELSRDLENIAYNDLYISAAKFKTLHE